MPLQSLLLVSLYFVIFVTSAYSLGISTIKFIHYLLKRFSQNYGEEIDSIYNGAAVMIGMGLLSNIFLLEGLAGHFYRSVIIGTLISVIIVLLPVTFSTFYKIPSNIFRSFIKNKKQYIAIGLIVIAIGVVVTHYFAAMLPPHLWDEMSYHFPEAKWIVQSHTIHPQFEAYYFFANLPKVMEVLYASAMAAAGIGIDGYALAHLTHFIVVIGFLGVTFSWLKKYYGLKTAAIGLLVLVLLDQLMKNAIIGYIDAATSAYEVAALLLVTNWLVNKKYLSLIVGCLLIGFGLGTKYSASPTALFILIIILGTFLLIKNHRVKILKSAPWLILALLFGCGYWYGKNIYYFNNPTYPFYFGHRGISDEEYRGVLNAIQEFGPKTLSNFITIIKSYLDPANIIVFWAIITFWIAAIFKKQRFLSSVLGIYVIYYYIYWFFFATHQDRFVISAMIVASLLFAVWLGSMRYRFLIPVTILLMAGSFFLIGHHAGWQPVHYRQALKEKLNYLGVEYAFGKLTTEKYMGDKFGCQFLILNDMQKNSWVGNVIDNWTIWHDPNVGFFADHNSLLLFNFSATATNTEVNQMLNNQGIKYLYFNQGTKEKFASETNGGMVDYRQGRSEAESRLLQNASLIDQQGPCLLYRLNPLSE